jgi:hypothetical protein
MPTPTPWSQGRGCRAARAALGDAVDCCGGAVIPVEGLDMVWRTGRIFEAGELFDWKPGLSQAEPVSWEAQKEGHGSQASVKTVKRVPDPVFTMPACKVVSVGTMGRCTRVDLGEQCQWRGRQSQHYAVCDAQQPQALGPRALAAVWSGPRGRRLTRRSVTGPGQHLAPGHRRYNSPCCLEALLCCVVSSCSLTYCLPLWCRGS